MQLKTVEIVDHDPSWFAHFMLEAAAIQSNTNGFKIYVDHVGSTSVGGMPSKPIVDILISLSEWSHAEAVAKALGNMGYHINEKCNKTPRYFLVKYPSDNAMAFHLHLCQPTSRWGREMIIFKNYLLDSDLLAKDYAALKRQLAERYKNDVPAYISGKRNFIETVIRTSQSEFSVNNLLTNQRAESNEAEALQVKMISAQLVLALLGAASVYSNDNKYLFVAAAFGFFVVLLWLRFNQKQQGHRAAGDQARRAVLLISGLGKELSPEQKLRIADSFKVGKHSLLVRREEDHFASREPPSYQRLTEMIEESSYWTLDLQNYSAAVMGFILLVAMLLILTAFGAALASFESDKLVSLSRAILAIMVFLISSDSLGLLLAYKSSVATINELFRRVEIIAERGFNDPDVLLLMLDYNAAIERAPTPLPGIFKLRRRHLTQRWRIYIDEKLKAGSK